MLIKSIYFWVITVVLLAVVIISVLKIIPPVITAYQDNQQKLADAEVELAKQQKFLAAVNTVKSDPESLDELYNKASLALPRTANSEILMLQLDGLLISLGLGAVSINVPFQPTATDASELNSIDLTISGNITYQQMTKLLPKLKTFSRWNRISSFDISKSADKYSSSITTKVFFQPGDTGEFSGNTKVLDQAKELFSDFQSYATNPDITTEGIYGRPDPFNP